MNLVCHVANLATLQQIFFGGWITGGCNKGGKHVLMCGNVIHNSSWLNSARPLDESWHAIAALPLRVLFTAKHGGSAIGPRESFRAVVAGIHNDGVLIQTKFL